ncbi:dienelactone hydrolase family protein [Colletotrichum truncatum]|uniref:Dienelactone hydrolase family protein n=1 Tax=Colletotrichum truncatum TaxID=5467 RepID=A0ACC3ZEY4_COLTU|nr:dienelactone hydrolase family protein [Colletotrichum truncatum]KAF6801381.1 dienelactone hydrolase family protein [Colletotrichum truncatum]
MTQVDVATKAPESDAAETAGETITEPVTESTSAADTPAQSTTSPTTATAGAGEHSEHCVTDRPTPAGQSSSGEIIKINDVDVYISKPADYPHAPARLLLLLTGGTGLKSTNNQIQADKFASEGFLVVMPDLFNGDTAPNSSTIDNSEDTGSFLDTFKLKIVETAKSFQIDMWLARQTEEKVLPILYRVIDGCKEKFNDAVKNGDGIYAVGYCIGGRYILHLGSERSVPASGQGSAADAEAGEIKKGPLIKVGAIAHGASVIPDDFQGIKVPISLVCVENDPLFPEEVRTHGEDVMSKANLEHEVQVYPGVPHGFAVVGDYQDASIKDAQATAYEQMLKWIKEH